MLGQGERVRSKVSLIASSLVGENGAAREACERIHTLIRQMPQPFWVDPFEVKAVAAIAPMTEAVLALRRRYSDEALARFRECRLGGEIAEGVYVYPLVPGPVR